MVSGANRGLRIKYRSHVTPQSRTVTVPFIIHRSRTNPEVVVSVLERKHSLSLRMLEMQSNHGGRSHTHHNSTVVMADRGKATRSH